VEAELPRSGHDVKRPELFARSRVEAADVLGRRFFLVAAVARAGRIAGDDDHIADDERPGAVVESRRERLVLLEVKARAPVIAEVGIGLAGFCVERVEILAADDEDALIAAGAPVVDAPRALPEHL